jgi:hypothetical protein
MSDLELIDAVAQVTGEDSHEIRRRGSSGQPRRARCRGVLVRRHGPS